jgi:hypothetical protein
MKYIRVKWSHSFPDEPIWLYSELDEDRWEVRTVEVYGDGHQGYASEAESYGSTGLSEEPIPPLAEIAANPVFEPAEITKEQFEQVWAKRKTG